MIVFQFHDLLGEMSITLDSLFQGIANPRRMFQSSGLAAQKKGTVFYDTVPFFIKEATAAAPPIPSIVPIADGVRSALE
jgi:hypothetical protein